MKDNIDVFDGNTGGVYTESGKKRVTYEENSGERVAVKTGLFAAKSYAFMAGGLMVSFVVAILTSFFFPTAIFSPEVYWVVLIGEIVVALVFGLAFRKLSPVAAGVLFFTYAILTGFTLSVFMMAYGFKTFYLAFGSTSLMFLVLSVIGFVTKKDVGRFGPAIACMLIALMISTIIAYFVGGVFEMLVCGAGVLVFGAITVYDIKKLRTYEGMVTSSENYNKFVIYSAMQLFLDYINILLYMIRFLAILNRKK